MKEMELYIHIPFCERKCLYCDFLSGVSVDETKKRYAKKVCEEIRYAGTRLSDTKISTIFIGGGTPNCIDPNDIKRIMETVFDTFPVDEDAEITMECNPGITYASGMTSGEALAIYRAASIDRLSIGLQSALQEELELLGRIHTLDDFLSYYDAARRAGFSEINIDVMTGLPGQTIEKLAQTLQIVTALSPQHISAYSLMIEKGTPFYDSYGFDLVRQESGMKPVFLPTEDEVLSMTDFLEETLASYGYEQYEISNFAKNGNECRHNVGYWTRVPYLGVGIGAASLLCTGAEKPYEARFEIRTANIRDLSEYLHLDFQNPDFANAPGGIFSPAWESREALSKRDAIAEFMFLGLRMTKGVTRTAFEDAFGVTIESVYGEVLRRLQMQHLLKISGGRISLTKQGERISNRVMGEFL